jgi:hypothetical protein
MKKAWLIAAGIVLALLLGVGGMALAQSTGDNDTQTPGNVNVNVNSQQTGIWVNGVGEITVTPDLATLTLGVEAQAASVAEAQSQAQAAMDKVMAALKAQGLAEKDIQTAYFNISKMTSWDDEKRTETITGYRVTNTVTVKIREIGKAGDIIDAVAEAGGDLTTVNGINFSLENDTAAMQQAREKAMADAKVKAQQIATLSDVKLGKATYVTENSYAPYAYRNVAYAESKDASGGTQISAGELTVTVNVQVAYAIAD